ncbi:MAG: hypothetical protein C0478_15050 [Planctomyces sp.]|nr:hypothetical protein [Planctomyces sp.]
MPLFEIETSAHIMVAWTESKDAAEALTHETFPDEEILRISRRPRDAWVISKRLLGLTGPASPSEMARDCLAKSHGNKIEAIHLYMVGMGVTEDEAQRAIETNMSLGW